MWNCCLRTLTRIVDFEIVSNLCPVRLLASPPGLDRRVAHLYWNSDITAIRNQRNGDNS